jgi:hypothetical protein
MPNWSKRAPAIARKGTAPSHAARSAQEATTALASKVEYADFFRIIANSTDPEDYREYLERFGETGQFAGLARRRIATHEKARAADHSLWTLIRENGRIVGSLLTGGAALVAILVFLGIQPGREAAQPEPVAEVPAQTTAAEAAPAQEAEAAPSLSDFFKDRFSTLSLSSFDNQVSVSTTAADGTPLPVVTGTVSWDSLIRVAGIPTLIGNLSLEGSDKARLIISNDGNGAQLQIDAMPLLVPALEGFDRITSVQNLPGTSGFMSFVIDPATPLETLKSLSYTIDLEIALAGADGRTGNLRVATAGAGWTLLQAALTGTGP